MKMTRNLKKRIAVLLAATMVMGSSSLSFASELPADENAEVYEVVDGAVDSEVDAAILEDAAEDEAVLSDAGDSAELNEEAKSTVSDITAEPTTWSTDGALAKYTYLRYLPRLTGYDDEYMVSGDIIYKNKKVEKGNPSIKADDFDPYYLSKGIYYNSVGAAMLSYNCIPVGNLNGKEMYVIYGYGIMNEFDRYGHTLLKPGNEGSASENNFFGLDTENIPGGVFDNTNFTWFDKSGSSGGNGKIVYDAAVVSWTKGEAPVKEQIFDVDNLGYNSKNRKYATVSFNVGGDGKWSVLPANAYLKGEKVKDSKYAPYFYPIFKVKKSYYDANGTKHKPDKDEKKFRTDLNKDMKKNHKIYFEIRRRPIAGVVSDNYISAQHDNGNNSYETPGATDYYATLIGDDLDFRDSGKLKKGSLQFVSRTYTIYHDFDSDDFKSSGENSGGGSNSQAIGYYLTHKLVMQKLKDREITSDLADSILGVGGKTFNKKKMNDAYYLTKKVGGENTLIVYGANNFEGVAAFRKRPDKTIGAGYYNSDDDCFLTSEED